jgi:hypothetical protein
MRRTAIGRVWQVGDGVPAGADDIRLAEVRPDGDVAVADPPG